MAKKYVVDYVSGSTGYGWQHEYDRLDEFEDFVERMIHNYTASVRVWDNDIQKFIFWKDCLNYKPSIDMLHDYFRDMRTNTRKRRCRNER